MSELITKDFLKAFGDKCKKIFKPQTTVINAPDDGEYGYIIIHTDLAWTDVWSVNIDISGKGFIDSNTDQYSGDIKFFGNISNQGAWEGRGYSLVDNEVIGICIDNYPTINGYKTRFAVQFLEPIKQVAIDIVNYLGIGTSNVGINSVQFKSSLGGDFSYNYILGSVDYNPSTIGQIIRLEQQSEVEQLLFNLPKENDDADLNGEIKNIPNDTTEIYSVNDSKWAKYIKTKHNIKLEEGDLKETTISFGGDNNTEITVSPLEINNSVQGNTEGEWFGKIKVNSKGLVTDVAPEEVLQVATDTTLGGIQIGYKEDTIEKNYPVSIDENNKAYVHVPWNDTDTWNKVADSDNLGLIKIGYTENNKNYPIELDSDNRAFVNVPWTDTKCEAATESELGSIKVGYTTTDKNYAVQLDSEGNAFVNVPLEPGETYDKATRDNLGLVKLGGSTDWFKSPLELEADGSAYIVLCKKPFNTTWSNGTSASSIPQYSDHSLYRHTVITSENPYTYTITIVKDNSYFLGIKNVLYRIDNKSQNPATIKVGCQEGVSISNMFDVAITSDAGLELPAGKTLELVFTYWDVNDVSFNGGFSV